jgi:hypothetical protein
MHFPFRQREEEITKIMADDTADLRARQGWFAMAVMIYDG